MLRRVNRTSKCEVQGSCRKSIMHFVPTQKFQSDCRKCTYNILTSGKKHDFIICQNLLDVDINKEFEKQPKLSGGTAREQGLEALIQNFVGIM